MNQPFHKYFKILIDECIELAITHKTEEGTKRAMVSRVLEGNRPRLLATHSNYSLFLQKSTRPF